MFSAKLGSTPAPAPTPSRSPATSQPAVTRPSEPRSSATRPWVPRDEFIRPGGPSRPTGPISGPAQRPPPTLPKELEPFRPQLDDLALKLASDPELVKDPVKLKQAIFEGIKGIEGIPHGQIKAVADYVGYQVYGAYSDGKERFGVRPPQPPPL